MILGIRALGKFLTKPLRSILNIKEHRVGSNARNARKILCVETRVVYGCLLDANKTISSGSVSDAMRSKSHYAGGYHWEYVD